jgi:hypothetical protein
MDDKKIEINVDEAKNIVDAIEFIFDEGYTGDGLKDIKDKLEKWIKQQD